jgi:choline kinase
VQVVLLAAGLGSRLGSLTTALPKALIEVGGTPLAVHALRFAARLRPSRLVVVGGFGFPLLAAALERATAAPGAALPLTLVENPRFRDGNLLSLLAARPLLDDDFLLLNVDHIYRPAIAALVTPPAADVTAFIDTDRALGGDDMKVERDGRGRVQRIALSRYLAAADDVLASDGPGAHVERVLARLAQSEHPPLCRDISGYGWLEVDTPDERARAEEALRDDGWA